MSTMNRPLPRAASLVLAAIVLLGGVRSVAAEEKSGPLAAKDLGTMLENMGFRTIVDESAKDSPTMSFHFHVTQGGLTFLVHANLSPDGTNLWLGTHLADLDPARLRADGLLALLDPSGLGEARFEYWPKSKQLNLTLAEDNRGITPAVLKDGIDELIRIALEKRALWEEKNLMREKP